MTMTQMEETGQQPRPWVEGEVTGATTDSYVTVLDLDDRMALDTRLTVRNTHDTNPLLVKLDGRRDYDDGEWLDLLPERRIDAGEYVILDVMWTARQRLKLDMKSASEGNHATYKIEHQQRLVEES